MHSVEDPPEDEFLGAPAAIPLEELLQGNSFVSMQLVRPRLGQDQVGGMKQVSVQGFELPGATLSYLDEVIH